MGLPTPDSLVKPFSDCLCSKFDAPGIPMEFQKPGVSPLIMGAIGAMLGPAAPIVKFIPPTPDIVKDITKLLTNLPSIVVEGFNSNATGLPQIPIEIPGVGKLNIGTVALPADQFNVKSIAQLISFVTALITAPITIFTGILESLISLQPKFPDLNFIIDILTKGFKSVGIPTDVITNLIFCLATSFMKVIAGIIP